MELMNTASKPEGGRLGLNLREDPLNEAMLSSLAVCVFAHWQYHSGLHTYRSFLGDGRGALLELASPKTCLPRGLSAPANLPLHARARG